MKLRVKYTAQLRDAVRQTEEQIELPEGSRLSELLLHLAARHSPARPHLVTEGGESHGSLLIVVNGSAVPSREAASVRLSEGDYVLLLPPIAGG